MLKAMKDLFEIISTNNIDTKVEGAIIKQSEKAKVVEKLMGGINSIN